MFGKEAAQRDVARRRDDDGQFASDGMPSVSARAPGMSGWGRSQGRRATRARRLERRTSWKDPAGREPLHRPRRRPIAPSDRRVSTLAASAARAGVHITMNAEAPPPVRCGIVRCKRERDHKKDVRDDPFAGSRTFPCLLSYVPWSRSVTRRVRNVSRDRQQSSPGNQIRQQQRMEERTECGLCRRRHGREDCVQDMLG